MKKSNLGNSSLFVYLLMLTVFFIILEISLLMQYSEVFFNDYRYIAHHLVIPTKVIPAIVFYVFAQLFLYVAFTFLVWAVARLVAVAFKLSWKSTEKLGFGLWIFSLITVLIANLYVAPNSKMGLLLGVLLSQKVAHIILIFCLLILAALCLIALNTLFSLLAQRIKYFRSSCLVLTLLVLAYDYNVPQSVITDAATREKPNIIIIGIDAVRPDFLGYFGYEKQTPFIDNFLNHATVFADSFTPLARTFPAWVSILTGKYPLKNGARTDLANHNEIKLQYALPYRLRQHGYQTVYASDETRFSNITSDFGFDTVVSAPMGFNDFFLGTINDFPISNLIVNTALGKYLFPHSYGNRPVSVTYDPNSFLNLLKPTLQTSREKPLFLSIHLCLPHLPYSWGSMPLASTPTLNYLQALRRADQQLNDLFDLLQKYKLLEHSIVILLSDHGEALELPGDRITEADLFVAGKSNSAKMIPRFYPPSSDDEAVNQSAGHGTDVLSLTQYHNLLAFRLYGLFQPNAIAAITGRVSLLDINPTLLDFLSMPAAASQDGDSLKPIILGKRDSVPQRGHFFIESDFSPQSVHSVHPETRKILFEGIAYFEIDPVTTRFTVKPSMEKLINSSKQVADIYGDWELALYPQANHEMAPILVNLQTGQWTNDLTTSFAKHSPVQQMLQSLQRFYH